MAKYRRAAKIDRNQPAIVDALRRLGYSVIVGHDDILVGHNGKTFWFEIKEPETVSKKTGRINDSSIKDSQKELLATYKGHYKIVWNVQQIIDDIKGINHVTCSEFR